MPAGVVPRAFLYSSLSEAACLVAVILGRTSCIAGYALIQNSNQSMDILTAKNPSYDVTFP